MRGENKKTKRWTVTLVVMIAILIYSVEIMKFNIQVAAAVTLIQALIMLRYGERLGQTDDNKSLLYPYLYFNLITISTVVVACYLIEQACYNIEESYYYWLLHAHKKGSKNIDLEIGTLLLINYFIFVGSYRKILWRYMREEINKWVPSSWIVILGCCLMLFSREGISHAVRVSTLFIGGGILTTQLIYENFISREQKVKFYISAKAYLSKWTFLTLAIWVVGNYIPEYQELPGTRWIRNVINSWGEQSYLNQRIPYETNLNSDISISNAVLFEVKASEPIYLREIAYTEYMDGKWKIPEGTNYESYIDLKFNYLEAEYNQTSALLDEMVFQNSQDTMLFNEYAKTANYESAIIRKKSYTVIQNPIDKINYFTVNGFYDIKDANSSTVYYYQNLNNCYFHSENMVEPSNYEVDYYDRVPKIGSREYEFLKGINGALWEQLYEKVVRNRRRYHLYDDKVPKILYSYTPMIQYQNAKERFLQVPDKLQQLLKELSQQIIIGQVSDWDRAEVICNFLKSNYKYHLQNRKVQGERVRYFLFEEKEGICQDFATSMVLMCRSIGIPAKYVTGYLVTEKNSHTGNYVVREKDAHAFVEVYIAGFGWMTFDPTPSLEAAQEKSESVGRLKKGDYIWAAVIAGTTVIFLMIYKHGLIYLWEMLWILSFKLKKRDNQLSYLLKRELLELRRRGLEKRDYETLSQYGKRLEEKEILIKKCIHFYENQRYGGCSPKREEINEAYQEYKVAKAKLKSLK